VDTQVYCQHARVQTKQPVGLGKVCTYSLCHVLVGATTPSQVAERIIAFLKAADKNKCSWFVSWHEDDIRAQAAAATQRWAAGAPLSIIDGKISDGLMHYLSGYTVQVTPFDGKISDGLVHWSIVIPSR
jgi:hypothetical protein